MATNLNNNNGAGLGKVVSPNGTLNAVNAAQNYYYTSSAAWPTPTVNGKITPEKKVFSIKIQEGENGFTVTIFSSELVEKTYIASNVLDLRDILVEKVLSQFTTE